MNMQTFLRVTIGRVRRLALCVLLLATSCLLPAQVARAAAAQDNDAYAKGMSALRRGEVAQAVEALALVPTNHPRFLEAMVRGGETLAEQAGRADLGLPLVGRAYRLAPDAQEVAYAWARVQLLARTNLTVPATARAHPAEVPAEFKWIADGPHFADSSRKISRRRLEADLDHLETMIANGYSYAERRKVDWRAALDAVRASLDPETPVNTFRFRLQRALTVFGDPHSALRGTPTNFLPRGYLPFIPVAHTQSRVLALRPDRREFLDAECPFVTALDGKPVEEWLRIAGYDTPQASPQFRRQLTVAGLTRVNYIRSELGLPANAEVRIALTSADGKKTRQLTLPLPAQFRPSRDPLSRATNRVIDGVGYLRIPQMSQERRDVEAVNEAMTRFRDTRGLIIDVRGNGGGSQDILRELMPYFMPGNAPMRVVNVAAYRVPVKFTHVPKDGFLPAYRSLHPVTHGIWTAPERAVILDFLRDFKPDWPLPAGLFSEWHVMGISPGTNPKAFRYGRPAIILSDAGCFSATDNFLGAFKGLSGVTIMGTKSGGGSGRMASYVLPNSRLPLTLCQMASFRHTGQLYDGAGVEPDVVVEAKETDHLVGGGDSVLEAALKALNR
jgi:hypothetical protein